MEFSPPGSRDPARSWIKWAVTAGFQSPMRAARSSLRGGFLDASVMKNSGASELVETGASVPQRVPAFPRHLEDKGRVSPKGPLARGGDDFPSMTMRRCWQWFGDLPAGQ